MLTQMFDRVASLLRAFRSWAGRRGYSGPQASACACACLPGFQKPERLDLQPSIKRSLTGDAAHCLEKGVSVWYLDTILRDEMVRANFTEDTPIYKMEPTIIRQKAPYETCPRDRGQGMAYVDALKGADNVGRATHMLSYSWSYSMLGEVVPALLHFCECEKLNPKRTYVWICCLCINQHRVQDKVPFAVFEKTFAGHVRQIGHVLALMSPWDGPAYLKRIWCVFEMFTALSTGTKVTVLMPPHTRKDLRRAIVQTGKRKKIYRSLTSVDVEEAEASVPEDREQVMQMIRESPGGAEELNCQVRGFIKHWTLTTLRHEGFQILKNRDLSEEEKAEAAEFFIQTGMMMFDDGDRREAVSLLTEAMGIISPADMQGICDGESVASRSSRQYVCFFHCWRRAGSLAGARLLRGIGFLELKQLEQDNLEQLKQLKQLFQRSLEAYEQLGKLESDEGATLLEGIGGMHKKTKNLQGAMDFYIQAYNIRDKLGILETPYGAGLISNIGHVNSLQGDLQAAKIRYDEAIRIREKVDSLTTPGGALLMTSIGDLQEQQGDLQGAFKAYDAAVQIRKKSLTLQTPPAAESLEKRGFARSRLGDGDGARQDYERAKLVRAKTQTPSTPEGKALLDALEAFP